MSALRLLRTIRYLQARQLVALAANRAQMVLPVLGATHDYGDFPGLRWPAEQRFLPPAAGDNSLDQMRRGRFTFLTQPVDLGWPPDWQAPVAGKLWRYNLHYFDYLWVLDYDDARALALDWIGRYPLARGADGWESYPTSLRLSNWCAYFWGRHQRRTLVDGQFQQQLWLSLAAQADWLAKHLEWHLMGNHLLENAAALAMCGACLEGPRARRWHCLGCSLLARELSEQVLADGIHFERSPMYQLRLVHVLAMLASSGDGELVSLVGEPLVRMARSLKRLCHPDGRIALLNDSGFCAYQDPEAIVRQLGAELEPSACPAEHGAFAFPEAGYFGSSLADGTYVICDAGPIGPDHVLGHAHGDIFSFELSYCGHRIITDSGTYDYLPGEMRAYCRSTAAHNTITVDDRDQCEFWGAFRVGRRAEVRDVRWQAMGEEFRLGAWHDGYRHLKGKAVHRRQFAFRRPGVLMFRDTVTSAARVRAASRLHLHPQCRIIAVEGGQAEVAFPDGRFAVCFAGPGQLSVERGSYCPQFGRRMDQAVLVFTAAGTAVEMGACIAPSGSAIRFDLRQGAAFDGRQFDW